MPQSQYCSKQQQDKGSKALANRTHFPAQPKVEFSFQAQNVLLSWTEETFNASYPQWMPSAWPTDTSHTAAAAATAQILQIENKNVPSQIPALLSQLAFSHPKPLLVWIEAPHTCCGRAQLRAKPITSLSRGSLGPSRAVFQHLGSSLPFCKQQLQHAGSTNVDILS